MKKSQLKHIIKEEIQNILNEAKQVGPLYHYTSADGLKGILSSNRINASEEYYLGNDLYYISFTRNKNFHNKGSKFEVKTEYRITLDGDKLSNRYKIIPFAYKPGWNYEDNWEYDWLEDEPESIVRDFFNNTGDYDEQEERISFKGPEGGIDNIKNYILSVDKVKDLQETLNDPFGLNEAKQVGPLYHFTYLDYIPKIFKQGIHFNPNNTELSKYDNMFSISATRDYTGRKFFKDSEYNVRITLDGNKISEHYSIEPINVNNIWAKNTGLGWGKGSVKDVYYEERIWSSKEGYLDSKYIIKMDTIVPEGEIKRQIKQGEEDSVIITPFNNSIFKYVDSGKLNFVKNFNTK